MRSTMRLSFIFIYIFYVQYNNYIGECITDVNMSHLQYLANNLQPGECRKLVASLHFSSHDIPNALQQAERKVIKDESCLQQLLHWNMATDQKHEGTTHEILARRLKQINRNDLSVWLANAAFNTINNSLSEIGPEDTFRMYEPIHLPDVNLTLKEPEVTTPELRITTALSLVRVVKQNVPDPIEDIVQDPTEWTIFDTISWSIVVILFLLIIVLLVYLILASPCNKKKRCRCSPPSSPRYSCHEYNMSSSVRSSPASCMQSCNQQQTENKISPQRHYDSGYTDNNNNKNLHAVCKKQQNDYSNKSNEMTPLYRCDCNCPRCKREFTSEYKRQAPFSETPSFNEVGSYNHPYEMNCPSCKVPPAPRPICHGGATCLANESHAHHNTASRTIDIHQKIAIPMNNVESSN